MDPKELQEYKAYLLSQGANPKEVDEYMAYQGLPPAQPEEPGLAAKALDYGLRGLDYAGGVARTGAGEVADAFIDGDNVTGDDWKRALVGKAPSSDELMDRYGVPEGGKVNLFPEVKVPFTDITLGQGETSAREAGGFVGDVALDPLTYVSLGGNQLAKGGLRAAVAPLSQGAKKVGKAMYNSAFKKIDEKLLEKGTRPLSQVMFKNRAWGGPESLQRQVKEIGERLKAEREALYSEADALGAKVDMKQASRRAQDEVNRLKGIRGAEGTANALEKHIKTYTTGKGTQTVSVPDHKLIEEADALTGLKVKRKVALDDPRPGEIVNRIVEEPIEKALPPLSISEASNVKTRFYDELPDQAYSKIGKVKGDAKRVNKLMGEGTKTEIERAANRVETGLGDEIAEINADWGSTIGAQKPMAAEVRKANTKNLVSSVDAGLAGYTLTNPVTGLPILVSKKMGDVAKGTAFRTGAGLGLDAIGNSGVLDPLTRQILIEQNRSPWDIKK